MIYFRMNDTAYPSLEDRDIDNGLRTLSFNLETDEPSNFTVFLIGNSSKKSSAYALTAQLNFTGLKTGREYDYAIYLCDRLSNCHNYTGSASTESVVTVATSASSSGGSGTSIMGVSKIWANMVEGENVMEISALSIAFTRLSIMLAKDINRTVTLTVSAVSLSNSTPSLDNPYQYIKIGESGISSQDIGSAVILFRVENEWLADIESVSLYRYTDKWDILDTQKVSSDSTYTYYRSNSPGLSLFGISGVKKIVEEAEPDGSGQPDVTGAVAADKKDILQPEREVPRAKINFSFSAILKYFLVGIVVLVLFSGVGFVVYAKGVHKEVDLSSLYKYVEECRRDGIEEEAIRKALMDSGWDKAIIDIGMTSVSIKTDLAPILDYIKKAREAGIKDDEIKVNLLSVGWSAKMISEAYDGFFK
jgi:PGF-pre-PGF domain-containing protein